MMAVMLDKDKDDIILTPCTIEEHANYHVIVAYFGRVKV